VPEPEQLPSSQRTQVRRIGDVIHKTAGPWSPSVHALLRHYEAVGFDGAPRVVGEGFDAEGNETISFVAGEFVHPHTWSDEGIAHLGRLLRRLHDAGVGFVPPARATWQDWFTRSDAPNAVFGHGDVGPWNIVARDGLPVAFIDWEFAGPVDRLDEVAHAAWLNAQLHGDDVAAVAGLPSASERARQLRLFVDGYDLAPDDRAGLVTRMIDFAVRDAAHEIDMDGGLRMAKRPTGPGDPAWGVAWRIRAAAWLVQHRALLEAALS
jgi:hypothetical protein